MANFWKYNLDFEKKFSKYIGSKYVSLNSCTSALELAVKVNGLKNDEVIVPSLHGFLQLMQ